MSINNEKIYRLALKLAQITGEDVDEAIIRSVKERIEREIGKELKGTRRQVINRIQNRISRLKKIDLRSDEEILGYDEFGLLN